MAEHLLRYGWDTVVVDIDWSGPALRSHGYNEGAELCMDKYGRLIPDPVRFPSSKDGQGFDPLAKKIHDMGLRFGIHTMRGIPRRAVAQNLPVLGTDASAQDIADPMNCCEWNPDMMGLDHSNPASQAYYDSTLDLYSRWGVDFIKADDMLWPYQKADIEAYSKAIDSTGRDIQLSLSPGRDLSLARVDHLRENATMWRICDDLWDRWDDVEANFARFARWAPYASPKGWPDGDMLPLGRIGMRAERGHPRDDALTPDERQTLMTLWVIARSPLMIGGDLPTSDPDTVALFMNGEVLEVLGSSSNNREVFREGNQVTWAADGPEGRLYAAVSNIGDEPSQMALDVQDIGFTPDSTKVRELWSGANIAVEPVAVQSDEARGVAPGSACIHLTLPAHGSALLRADV